MFHVRFPALNDNHDWASLIQSYKHHVTDQSNVLEIGASTAERTLELAGFCKHLTGVEISPERIPTSNTNITYTALDWQDLSTAIPADSIDVAVASHVIEHVTDDQRAINELYKVLKPGGVAILNTPNRKRLTRSIIETVTGPRSFPHWEHVREYTEEDLTKLFEQTDFTKWQINALVFGLHGGPIFAYSDKVPKTLRHFANYWEILLFKDDTSTEESSGSSA